MKIASLSLRDYPDDLVAFVNSLDHAPLLVGHSQGGLLAQLVGAHTPCWLSGSIWEMFLAASELSKATVVDFAAITTPVLVVGAERDRFVPSGVVRRTAAKYQHGTFVEIPWSDHMVFSKAALPVTIGHIENSIARNHVLAIARCQANTCRSVFLKISAPSANWVLHQPPKVLSR